MLVSKILAICLWEGVYGMSCCSLRSGRTLAVVTCRYILVSCKTFRMTTQ